MQKTTDCIFIFSPGPESSEKCFDYHLGNAYLAAYLKSNGFISQQYIRPYPVNLKTCLKEILACNPGVAGFTVYDTNFNISVLLAEEIKKSSPGTVVVFGGPCPSVHSGFIMNSFPFVDACFINEAEETFMNFISKLSDVSYKFENAVLSGIQGIFWRQAGKIHSNHENCILLDGPKTPDYLDNYPSPYLSGIIPPNEGHKHGILTTRGCNQNCVYCNCAVLSNRKIYTHSVGRVIEELTFISEFMESDQILTFQDDTFTLLPNRAREICRSIIDNRIRIKLACITRCDSVDESLLDLMKEAGFISLTFSLESAVPEILRRIGKVHVAEDYPSDGLEKEAGFLESFHRVAAYAKKTGIKYITSSAMIGLPGETINEAHRTIEALDRNANIDQYSHNFLKISKGTPLSLNYEKYGYRLRFINNNPIYAKMVYPADYAGKVFISPKSHLHSLKKVNDKSSLGILSLTSGECSGMTGFRNIILLSDHVRVKIIKWLKEVLAINGTIIQIYSNEKLMNRLRERNYEKLIRYYSPSLNIRSYYLEEKSNQGVLLSPESLLLKCEADENIKFCGFDHFRTRMDDPAASFVKTVCMEKYYVDSVEQYSFLEEISLKKDPFRFMSGKKAMPYFSNLCKWTHNHANCINRNTLIINEKNEVRFCWKGDAIGFAGQSYNKLISNLESETAKVRTRRDCQHCAEESTCIKCPFPNPLPENEYCRKKKSAKTNVTADLIIGLDQLKQIFF